MSINSPDQQEDRVCQMTELINCHYSEELFFLRRFFSSEKIVQFAIDMGIDNHVASFAEHIFSLIFCTLYNAEKKLWDINMGRNLVALTVFLRNEAMVLSHPKLKKLYDQGFSESSNPLFDEYARSFIQELAI